MFAARLAAIHWRLALPRFELFQRATPGFDTQRAIDMKDDNPSDQKPTPIQLIGSVVSAAVGIQNSKHRERDFKHGKASSFVIAGALFAVLFAITVFSVVQFVLKQAGG